MWRYARFAVVFASSVLIPTSARAQLAWDSPMLLPPGADDGVGVLLMEAHGGGLGGLLTWRAPDWNFGVRGGVAETGGDDDIGLLAGIDVSGSITRSTQDFPLDIDWVFGAGLGVHDGARISLPLGLSIGHTFRSENATFLPYATPRVVLDAFIDDDDRGRGPDDDDFRDGDDVDLGVALDLGLDLRVTPAFIIRFAATVGDREAVALGLVF